MKALKKYFTFVIILLGAILACAVLRAFSHERAEKHPELATHVIPDKGFFGYLWLELKQLFVIDRYK